MKSKTHTFTEEEMVLVREALIEEYQRLRNWLSHPSNATDRGYRRMRVLESLKDQFIADCRKL